MKSTNAMCMLLLLSSIGSTANEVVDQPEVEELETNVEIFQTEVTDTQEELEALQQSLTKLEDKSSQLHGQLRTENENLQELLLKAEEALEDVTDSKQKEIDDLQQLLTELDGEFSQLQEQLRTENEDLQQLLAELAEAQLGNSDLQSLLAKKLENINIEKQCTRHVKVQMEQLIDDWYLSMALNTLLTSGATIAIMKMFF